MNKNFKRIIAYILDTLLITLIAVSFTYIKPINFQLESYNNAYENYEKVLKKYEKLEKKYETAKEDLKDKEISKSEYTKLKKEYNSYKKTYEIETKKVYKRQYQYSIVSTIIQLALIFAYFGIFQYSMGGQTIGKKLMKLKVVSKDDNKDLGLVNYLLRAIILNGVIAPIFLMVFASTLNYNDFYIAQSVVGDLNSVLQIVIIIMVFMRVDNRGLHDIVGQTKVIEITADGKEAEYIPPTKKTEK